MKNRLLFVLCGLACAASPVALAAADNPPDQPKRLPPEQRRAAVEELRKQHPEAFEKLREEIKNLPPEERQKRLREFREKHGAPLRDELEKRREELKDLPPAERKEKLAEIRERLAERRKQMSADERKAKRQEIQSRLDKQLALLREKKTNGTITASESKRLQRLEIIDRRFHQAQAAGDTTPPSAPQ